MAASIKATMGVDGASKFKSDLNAAKQSVKELDSELKLAESQFKATGDKEQYMADKASTLKQQINAQENVIGLLNNQLKSATEKYGANSDKVSKLKTELNKAKTSQNNMKAALKDTETPLETTATDTGTLAEKMTEAATNTGNLDTNLQNVVAHLDLQAVANFANNVASAIEGAAKRAKELAVGVWNLGTSAGSTADEWLTLSQQTGISVEDIQKWSYAGRFVDTTLENITGSMTKFRSKYSDIRAAFDEMEALQNKRANTTNKNDIAALDKQIANLQGKALALKNDFNIDIYDAQHNLRSTADVYWDMIDVIGNAYNNGNQELAEQAAMDYFGRSAANLNPLFKAGKQAFMELGDEAEQLGYIMSEADVQALGAFDDQTQQLQASIEALKLSMANELLPLLTPVAEGFTNISDELIKFIGSEEGQKAISDMASAVGTVFDDMSGKIPEAVQNVTTLVSDFASGFTNAESAVHGVITAVQTLAAVWAASKLVSFGASMIEAGKTISGFFANLLGKGAGAASGAGSAAASAPVKPKGPAPVAMGRTLLEKGSKLGQFMSQYDPTGAAGLILPVLEDYTAFGRTLRNGGSIGDAIQASEQAINEFADGVRQNASTFQKDWEENAIVQWASSIIGGGKAEGNTPDDAQKLAYSTDVYADALKRLNFAMQELEDGNGDTLLRDSIEELKGADIENIFSPDVIQNMMNYDEIPAESFAGFVQALHDQLAVAAGESASAAGGEIMTQVAEGMWEEMELVDDAGESAGESAVNGVQSGADSGAAMNAGLNIARGLASGMLRGSGLVSSAGRTLASIASASVKSSLMIKSPSKVMEGLGKYTAEGFALGIENGAPMVGDATARMMSAVTAAPVYGSAGSGSGGYGADQIISALNGATVVMDGETVGRLIFPHINAEMGEITARRYAS